MMTMKCSLPECNINTTLRCGRCGDYPVCSYKHFKAMWHEHKDTCSQVNTQTMQEKESKEAESYAEARRLWDDERKNEFCIMCQRGLDSNIDNGHLSHIIPNSVFASADRSVRHFNIQSGTSMGRSKNGYHSFCKVRTSNMSCEDILSVNGEQNFNENMHAPLVERKDRHTGDNALTVTVENCKKAHYCTFSIVWRVLALSVSKLDGALRRRVLTWLRRTRQHLLDPSKSPFGHLFDIYVWTPDNEFINEHRRITDNNEDNSSITQYYGLLPTELGGVFEGSFEVVVLMGPLYVRLIGHPIDVPRVTGVPGQLLQNDSSFTLRFGGLPLILPEQLQRSVQRVQDLTARVNSGSPPTNSTPVTRPGILLLPPVFRLDTNRVGWDGISSSSVQCIEISGINRDLCRVYAADPVSWTDLYTRGFIVLPFYIVQVDEHGQYACLRVDNVNGRPAWTLWSGNGGYVTVESGENKRKGDDLMNVIVGNRSVELPDDEVVDHHLFD